ncbi:MAG TPA: CarD family transcriptional regulator [Anaeromyxobacteraceae bacterium]|nr:CarD family transcriptional regulator [Anaeromyxobacteraceae bacterium]
MKGPPPRHPDEPKQQFPVLEGTITDASTLREGDRVVYPNQGVCAVVGFQEFEYGGARARLVRLRREEDGSFVSVNVDKVPAVGLRRVASGEQMEGVFHYLAASFDEPELDWKVRHRDNVDRLIAGGVLGVAEVVKGLHSLSRIRPLPTKEREVYDNARHLLVAEVAASLGAPPAVAEDLVDYALMPPAGVKFQLKPPPKPVVLPVRPRYRRPAVVEEDLGLADLGLAELVPEAVEGEATPEEGAPAAAEEEAEPARPAARAAPAAKRAKAPARKPPPAEPRRAQAKKKAPRKAAPARKPARKSPAKKGKKK